MKVFFTTFGCKVNQYETQEMSELLCSAGFSIMNNHKEADIIIVNSCTVTAEGVRKVRQTIRKLNKENPTADAIASKSTFLCGTIITFSMSLIESNESK